MDWWEEDVTQFMHKNNLSKLKPEYSNSCCHRLIEEDILKMVWSEDARNFKFTRRWCPYNLHPCVSLFVLISTSFPTWVFDLPCQLFLALNPIFLVRLAIRPVKRQLPQTYNKPVNVVIFPPCYRCPSSTENKSPTRLVRKKIPCMSKLRSTYPQKKMGE